MHAHTNGVIRGYSDQGGAVPRFALNARGFGRSFKRTMHKEADSQMSFHSYCEGLSSHNNFVELDPSVADAWGIPVLRIHVT